MKQCSVCETEADNSAPFCGNCGSKLPDSAEDPPQSLDTPEPVREKLKTQTTITESESSSTTDFRCPQCNEPYNAGITFCGNCGYNLQSSQPAQSSPSNNSQPVSHQPNNDKYSVPIEKPASYNYDTRSGNKDETKHPDAKDIYTAILVSLFIPGFSYMWIGKWDYGIGTFIVTILLLQIIPELQVLGALLYFGQLYFGKRAIDEYNANLQ